MFYKQRQLLFSKKFLKESKEDEFEEYATTTIDLIEEKLSSKSTKQYLGLLCRPSDGYQIYGYLTNTNIAILAIIKNVNIRESEVKSMLIAMHQQYINYVSNPFSLMEQKIISQDFNYKIQITGNKYTTQILQVNNLSNAKKPIKSNRTKK